MKRVDPTSTIGCRLSEAVLSMATVSVALRYTISHLSLHNRPDNRRSTRCRKFVPGVFERSRLRRLGLRGSVLYPHAWLSVVRGVVYCITTLR